MMDMKKKLSRLRPDKAMSEDRPPLAEESSLDAPIGRADSIKARLLALANRQAKPKRRGAAAASGLAGSVRSNARGELHVVGQAFDPDHLQGSARLRRGLVATG
ncbi:MAG TPA: hypothetical protein VLC93_16490 [Myxococcota bacterium]|nr:hypothetical protein [Myxococcota bacterium]